MPMPLAGLTDYLFVWQLPLFVLYAAAWLIGGPFLARWALRRMTDLPRTATALGQCARFNLLTNGAGLVAMVVLGGAFTMLAGRMHTRALLIVGLVLGTTAMLGLAWAVSLTLMKGSAGTLLRVVGVNTGGLILLGALIGIGAFIPARAIRRAELNRQIGENRLLRIHRALQMYSDRFPGREAPNLKALEETGLLSDTILGRSGKSDLAADYFYLPSPGVPRAVASQKIRVCDRHGTERMVLFANGRVEQLSRAEFDDLLRRPENADLAEMVGAGP